MSYLEMMNEIYAENRVKIRNYVIFSAVVAILLSMQTVGNVVLAAVSELSNSQLDLLSGNSYKQIILLFNGIGIGIDGAGVFTIQAIISFVKYFFGVGGAFEIQEPTGVMAGVLGIDLGLMDTLWIAIVVMIVFLIPKLCKMFGTSRILGVTLEDLERKIGGILVIVLTLYAFLDGTGGTSAAYASTGGFDGVMQGIEIFVHILTLFGLLILVRFIYYIISTVYFFLDIILIPASVIPFTSAGIELFKSGFVLVLYYLAHAHPEVFLVIAIILFTICCIIFKKAYMAVRYFKKIYVKPLIHTIFKSKKKVQLVAPKIPKKIKWFLGDKEMKLAIMTYAVRKFYGNDIVKKYEPWWLIVTEEEVALYKTKLFGKSVKKIAFGPKKELKIYILKSIRFFEIFTIREPLKIKNRFSKAKTAMHFVFSKEYSLYYEEIKQLLNYEDFAELKSNILKQKKEVKKEIKEEVQDEVQGVQVESETIMELKND